MNYIDDNIILGDHIEISLGCMNDIVDNPMMGNHIEINLGGMNDIDGNPMMGDDMEMSEEEEGEILDDGSANPWSQK